MGVVKYSNDLNEIKLGSFTENETDVFFSLLFKLKDRSDDTIEIKFSDLRKLADINNRSSDRLIKCVEEMAKKLIKLNQKIILPSGEIVLFNLFRTLKINPESKLFTVSINKDFQYMLNDLVKNFTLFDLKAMTSLNSNYSKITFRLLKQFSSTGMYCSRIDKFRELLDVPKTFNTSNFNTWVLAPIKKELKLFFKNLKVIKLGEDQKILKKGKKAIYIKFTWVKESKVKSVNISKSLKEKPVTVYEHTEIERLRAELSKKLVLKGFQPLKDSKIFGELASCESNENIINFIEKYKLK